MITDIKEDHQSPKQRSPETVGAARRINRTPTRTMTTQRLHSLSC